MTVLERRFQLWCRLRAQCSFTYRLNEPCVTSCEVRASVTPTTVLPISTAVGTSTSTRRPSVFSSTKHSFAMPDSGSDSVIATSTRVTSGPNVVWRGASVTVGGLASM